MNLAAGLRALNLTLPQVTAPVAAYIPALSFGRQVRTAGQLPFRGGQLVSTGVLDLAENDDAATLSAQLAPYRNAAGILPPDLDPQELSPLARAFFGAQIAAAAGLAAAAQAAGGAENISRVLHVTGYVASAPGFTAQPAVLNGASHFLEMIFGRSDGAHTRSAVGVSALPLGATVEVELTCALSQEPK